MIDIGKESSVINLLKDMKSLIPFGCKTRRVSALRVFDSVKL